MAGGKAGTGATTTRPQVSMGPDHIVATSMIMSSWTRCLWQCGQEVERAEAVDSIPSPLCSGSR